MILNHRLSNREICAFLLLPFSLISVVCEGWSWNDRVFLQVVGVRMVQFFQVTNIHFIDVVCK